MAHARDLERRGDVVAAAHLYQQIRRDNPSNFDATHSLGILLLEHGAIEDAIGLINAAVAIDPARASAYHSLGRAQLALGRPLAALASVTRALELDASLPDAWFLRGNILQLTGQLDASVECYEQALSLRPEFAEAFNNLAAALRALRNTRRALECTERALALKPAYAKALNNRGLILLDCYRQAAAVEDFRCAVALSPQFAEALHNLGATLLQLRRFEEALDAFSRLAEVAPNFPHVRGNLLRAKLSFCDWSDFEALRDAVTAAVGRGEPGDVPMSFVCISGSAALQLRCAQTYTATFFPAQAQAPYPSAISRPRQDRIRIAYLSGDFGEHAVTYLLAGVLARHDRTRFEPIAFSWDRRHDGEARHRLTAAFAQFIDVTDVSDAEVARVIQEFGIDIAVDLTGHTLGNRTGIFARRAAPIQVNYLGHPGSMGADYIDYMIADRFLVPEVRFDAYSERIVWLPCFQPNDDRRALPFGESTRSEHGLPDEGFVFCSFNNNAKLTPNVFDVWMRLLARVPGCVLWLLTTSRQAADNLRREAARRGVDAGRLVFAEQAPYRSHLRRYPLADLFLDSVPFNGGATASDALSMGLPVLTCAGESFAGRMAGSLLTYLGIPELVTSTLAEYESRAVELAGNPPRLRAVRERLARAHGEHPFFDTDRYGRNLEAAYLKMWERHAAGLPPVAFAVDVETP